MHAVLYMQHVKKMVKIFVVVFGSSCGCECLHLYEGVDVTKPQVDN